MNVTVTELQRKNDHMFLYLPTALIPAILLFCAQPAAAQWTTNGNDIYTTNTVNVGIGTSGPNYALEVYKSGQTAQTLSIKQDYPNNGVGGGLYWNVAGAQSGYIRQADNGSSIYSTAFGNYDAGNGGLATRMIINGSKVGIGTTNPASLFELPGFIRTTGDTGQAVSGVGLEMYYSGGGYLQARDAGASAYTPLNLYASRINLMNGNVGIGTTSSTSKLHLYSGDVRLQAAGHTTGNFSETRSLLFTQETDAVSAEIRYSRPSWSNAPADLSFLLRRASDGALTERLRLNQDGNVNIAGNVAVDGNIAAKYQDIAEWVPVSQPIAAGSVVILDPVQTEFVTESSTPYDTRVAGVVSPQPGIVLGEAGANKVRVATTGRVKVHVDATSGPIHSGDLLVTSDKPGIAMRSEPVNLERVQMHRPGTIIGKAIESLEQGQGEILVLLSLQ